MPGSVFAGREKMQFAETDNLRVFSLPRRQRENPLPFHSAILQPSGRLIIENTLSAHTK
jgi:hypothetical protein